MAGPWRLFVVPVSWWLRSIVYRLLMPNGSDYMIVRKLRLQRGWTQDQLAQLTGLSVRTVQRLERGEPASLETARALASVFGVDFSSFRPPPKEAAVSEEKSNVSITIDEREALAYAKRVREFYESIGVYLVLAAIFFAVFGRNWVVFLVFIGTGIGIAIQGLLTFEIIRLPFVKLERRIAESKLGRPL